MCGRGGHAFDGDSNKKLEITCNPHTLYAMETCVAWYGYVAGKTCIS